MRVEVPAQAIYRPLDEILAAAKAVAPPNGVPDGFGIRGGGVRLVHRAGGRREAG